MRSKLTFTLVLLTVTCHLFAQESTRLSIMHRMALENLDSGQSAVLNVRALSENIEPFFRDRGLSYRCIGNGIYVVRGNSDQLMGLSDHPLIGWIETGYGRPQWLCDSMLSNNRIRPVHQGESPLNRPYTGKGVVIGFIDTGLDFNHPDFKDSSGQTRVLKIWDQRMAATIPARVPAFGYGQVWDSADINNGICPHDDDVLSHGTNVTGIAAGNGLGLGRYKGVAPDAHILSVASNFSAFNWLSEVADGVEFIFNEADQLGLPCVVNISAGDYLGSHDGSDVAAVRINDLIKAKKGRAVVAAVGNAGNLFYHLGYDVTSDTNFTWFQYNAANFIGLPGVYFQLWADTAEFSQVRFAMSANKPPPSYSLRGISKFDKVTNRLNMIVKDTISSGTHILGFVETFATVIGDKYFMEVLLNKPDSSSYYFGFTTTGSGHFDIWSDTWIGTSHMVKAPLPAPSVYPDIIYYKQPDTLQTMVSSFTCLPSVITVSNYINRNSYFDYDTILRNFPVVAGDRATNSSLGPNRRGEQKPDISASGDYTLTANRLASVPLHLANNQADRIAVGGMHKRNGGSSMAAPVVTGTIALMFEQCSDLNDVAIREALTDSAYRDGFTGTSVNEQYGFGKLNAIGSLKIREFRPSIDPSGRQSLCIGSHLTVSGPPFMKEYHWSSGSLSQSFSTDSSGYYFLEAADTNGCRGISDTLQVVRAFLPPEPVISAAGLNKLISTPAATYQWYLNNNVILGAKSQSVSVLSDGNYTVFITDSNGCGAISQPRFARVVSTVDVPENPATDFQVYPVPSSDGLFYVSVTGPKVDLPINAWICNGLGEIVFKGKIKDGSLMDLSMQPSGIFYLLVGSENGKTENRKLIIRH